MVHLPLIWVVLFPCYSKAARAELGEIGKLQLLLFLFASFPPPFVQITATPPLLSCQIIPKHTHMVQAAATRALYQTRQRSSTVPCFKSMALAGSQAARYF